MLFSEGIGFGQGLSSQHEGDRIVVRRLDAAVRWRPSNRPCAGVVGVLREEGTAS
jgi:hypothetical protein